LIEKHYISAEQLLDDSFKLGLKVLESGFTPNYIIGVWRGGTPVGIAIQELLEYCGSPSDHIAIRTSHYTGIAQTTNLVKVHGLHYIVENINCNDKLLIVDDVFDSGRSIKQVITELNRQCRKNTPHIKTATPYFKPGNNQTDLIPDFYLYETEKWLIFPHELLGLSVEELVADKPGIETIVEKLRTLPKPF